jgi:hypothetical protein
MTLPASNNGLVNKMEWACVVATKCRLLASGEMFMTSIFNLRRLVLLGAAIVSTQLLSACVVTPVGGHHIRGNVVVDVAPSVYYRPAPPVYYYPQQRYYYHPHRW